MRVDDRGEHRRGAEKQACQFFQSVRPIMTAAIMAADVQRKVSLRLITEGAFGRWGKAARWLLRI